MFQMNLRATARILGLLPLNPRKLSAQFHTRSISFNEQSTATSPATNATVSSSSGSSSASAAKSVSSVSSSTAVKPKSYFDDPLKTPEQVKSKLNVSAESQSAANPVLAAAPTAVPEKPSSSFLGNLFNRQSIGVKPSANPNPAAAASSSPIFHSASQQASANKQPSSTRVESFLNVGFTLLIGVLIYFAIDNYHARLLLQDEMFEKTLKQQKALAIAQASFKNVREKREMQMLNERKNTQKREMKMALHIGLLRQQLKDAGIDPVDISFANKEFERSVKMENSLANLTGTSLWVVDEADIKKYMPNTHDYDNRNGK